MAQSSRCLSRGRFCVLAVRGRFDRPEALTNDFFVNLLDMGTAWKAASDAEDVFEGRDRASGDLKWTGARVDLVDEGVVVVALSAAPLAKRA